MRYYSIVISDPTNGKVVTPPSAPASATATYSSFVNNATDPNAQDIELDIFATTFALPIGDAFVRVWGVSLQEISQASDLINKTVKVFGGMKPGLPLATAASSNNQAGLLVQGFVQQAIGNWVGTDMTLDLVIRAGSGPTASQAKPIQFVWKAGTKLADAVTASLNAAYSGYKVMTAISSKVSISADENARYNDIVSFCQYLKSRTAALVGGTYPGVDIYLQDNAFTVFDGSSPSKPKTLLFQDLIGQPTWIDSPFLQTKTVLRADINVGDSILMPKTAVTTTPAANAYARQSSQFQGTFLVKQVRHVGHFRSPDSRGWATIIDASPNLLAAT